jgi:hypothetical protein
MRDARDEHEALDVVDGVDDPVVADAHTVVVSPGELHTAGRAWVRPEPVNGALNSVAHASLQTAKLAGRRREQSNDVLVGDYSRTSAHGTALSRSSRAWTAARLSSRYSRRSSRSA